MRFSRLLVVMTSLIFCPLTFAQQSQQDTAPQAATRDAQAVGILTQALAAAGGSAGYGAITDYVATGTITYFGAVNGEGAATISGRGPSELRVDANLPPGMRSDVINGAQATVTDASGITGRRNIQAPMMSGNFVLPYRELAMIFNNLQFSIAYNGIVQINGHSLHDIRAQRVFPGQNNPLAALETYHTLDFFIDSSTLTIYMTADALPRRAAPRTIQYSNYQVVNGILVPFVISEMVGGQQTSIANLSQVNFNVGLQDSTFDLSTVQ